MHLVHCWSDHTDKEMPAILPNLCIHKHKRVNSVPSQIVNPAAALLMKPNTDAAQSFDDNCVDASSRHVLSIRNIHRPVDLG